MPVQWTPRSIARRDLEGRHVYLKPINCSQHAEAVYHRLIATPDGQSRFKYFQAYPPQTFDEELEFLKKMEAEERDVCYVIFENKTNEIVGTIGFCRVVEEHGASEIGLCFGDKLEGTIGATEAKYLLATYFFDEIGCRR